MSYESGTLFANGQVKRNAADVRAAKAAERKRKEAMANAIFQAKPPPCERGARCQWFDHCKQYEHLCQAFRVYLDGTGNRGKVPEKLPSIRIADYLSRQVADEVWHETNKQNGSLSRRGRPPKKSAA